MKKFQYQLLRYRPDQVSGEFVNVGLVLFGQVENFLAVKSAPSVSRAKSIFPNLKGTALQNKLKHFAERLNEVHAQKSRELNLNPITDITQITYTSLPQDDSSLYWSEVSKGIDVSFDAAFDDLFSRLITHHTKQKVSKTSDQEVWRVHYKSYFERPEIKDLLRHHTVHTDNNTIEFEHAVKNGVWHLMEPLAFNLKSEQGIKSKVYKWMGKVQELERSTENFKLYFLTSLPEAEEMRAFVKDRLEQDLTGSREVEVIVPEEADELVRQLLRAVEED